MASEFANKPNAKTIDVEVVDKSKYDAWLGKQSAARKTWLQSIGFKPSDGSTRLLPAADGTIDKVLLVVRDRPNLWSFAGLPRSLPEGRYNYTSSLKKTYASEAALGWALGSYRFERYKSDKTDKRVQLVWPKHTDKRYVQAVRDATALGRDLISTPAEDMGPGELASASRKLANKHKARCTVIKGEELLKKNYPTIHTVGRASDDPPRLIDIRWGKTSHPKLSLVGKGVCFDTGGLNLKPGSSMLMMKKDMGGAATVLALASLIMELKLPVRLRVLVPAVENNIAGNAYRPKDIITTRKGTTVEVDNTDAEGRLVMSDALTEACREKPDLLMDFATLTGAARVALGTDLPALFCNRDKLADAILSAGKETSDPLWRMPLHKPYRKKLNSKVADIANVASNGYGGAITAALFLQEFVEKDIPWVHVDTMGFNQESKPGRPYGGEPFGIRAMYAMLAKRYS